MENTSSETTTSTASVEKSTKDSFLNIFLTLVSEFLRIFCLLRTSIASVVKSRFMDAMNGVNPGRSTNIREGSNFVADATEQTDQGDIIPRAVEGSTQVTRILTPNPRESSLGMDESTLDDGHAVASGTNRIEGPSLPSPSSGAATGRGGANSLSPFPSLPRVDQNEALRPMYTNSRGNNTAVWPNVDDTAAAAITPANCQARLACRNCIVRKVNYIVDQEKSDSITVEKALQELTKYHFCFNETFSLSSRPVAPANDTEPDNGTSSGAVANNTERSTGNGTSSGAVSTLEIQPRELAQCTVTSPVVKNKVKDNFEEGMEFHTKLMKLMEHTHQPGESCYTLLARMHNSCMIERDLAEAALFFNIGKCQERLRHFGESKRNYREVERLLNQAKTTYDEVEMKCHHHKLAIDAIDQALLISMSQIFYEEKNYDSSLATLINVLNLTDSSDDLKADEETRSNVKNCIGVVQYAKTQDMNEADQVHWLAQSYSNFQEALVFHAQVLKTESENSSPSFSVEQRLTFATVLNNQGRVSLVQEKYEEALALFQKVYELREQFLGWAHMDTFVVCCSIAHTAEQLGQEELPEQMFKRFLEAKDEWVKIHEAELSVRTDVKGAEIFDEGVYLANKYLGNLYKQRNEFLVSRGYHVKALEAAESAFGRCHHTTASMWVAIGHTWYGDGDWVEAKKHYEKALSIEVELNEGRICLMRSYENIAECCYKKAKDLVLQFNANVETSADVKFYFETAKNWYDKWWVIQEPELEAAPEDHDLLRVLEALLSMSETFLRLRNIPRGGEILKKWLVLHYNKEDKTDLDWGFCLLEAGAKLYEATLDCGVLEWSCSLQFFVESRKFICRADVSQSDVARKRQADCHVSTLDFMAAIHQNSGNFIDGMKYLQQMKDMHDLVNGFESHVEDTFCEKMAKMNVEIGEIDKALNYFRLLLRVRIDALESESSNRTNETPTSAIDIYQRKVAETRLEIAEILLETGQYDSALSMLEEAQQSLLRISHVVMDDAINFFLTFRWIGEAHYAKGGEGSVRQAMEAYREAENYAGEAPQQILRKRKMKWAEAKQQWGHHASAA